MIGGSAGAGCVHAAETRRTAGLALALALALVFVGGRWQCAVAAESNMPLAHLVPADAGLCVEVTNLAASWDEIRGSELYRRVREFPPLKRFLADNSAEIDLLAAELHHQTGLSFDELLVRFLGQELLVAVWPCEPGNELQPGPALALVNCEDAALLENVAARLIAAERAAGRRVARGQWRQGEQSCVMYRIDANAGQPALYMAHLDHVGILATDEALVQQVLARRVKKGQKSLAERAEYIAGAARLNPRALVRVFVDPPAWKNLIAAHADQAGELSAGAEDWLAQHFRQADYFVASCEVGEQLVCEAFLHNRQSPTRSAASTQAVSQEGATVDEVSPDLALQVPADAVAAFAGRVDLLPLLSTFFSCDSPAPTRSHSDHPFPSPHSRRALSALVSRHGPHAVAAFVPRKTSQGSSAASAEATAPSDKKKTDFDWVVGFDTHDLLPDDRRALTRRIDPLLRAGLTAAIVMYNRQGTPTSIDSIEEEGVPLTTVGGLSLLGQGDSATFSLQKSYFWAGTARAAVRDIARLEPAQSLGVQPAYRALQNPRIAGPTHLAYLDLTALLGMLEAAADGKAPVADEDRLGGRLSDVAALADRLLVEIRVDATGVALSATLSADSTPAQ